MHTAYIIYVTGFQNGSEPGHTSHRPPRFLSSLAASGMTDPEESPQGAKADVTWFEQSRHDASYNIIYIYIHI